MGAREPRARERVRDGGLRGERSLELRRFRSECLLRDLCFSTERRDTGHIAQTHTSVILWFQHVPEVYNSGFVWRLPEERFIAQSLLCQSSLDLLEFSVEFKVNTISTSTLFTFLIHVPRVIESDSSDVDLGKKHETTFLLEWRQFLRSNPNVGHILFLLNIQKIIKLWK